MANGKLNLMYGTYDAYKSLDTYDNDTLYFVEGIVYKGNVPYGTKIEQVNALADTGSQGTLYLTPDKSLYFWDGDDWQIINVGIVSTIEDADVNDGKVVTQAAIKAYVQAKIANLSTDDATEAMITAKVNAAVDEAKGELTAKDTELDEKINDTKADLEAQIDAKVASVFKFKGTKETFDELNSVEGAVVGDVWHVDADGKEYVFVDVNDDGAGEWELLGFTVNLSEYSTTEEISQAISNAVADVYKKTEVYTKEETDAAIKVVSDNLALHADNTDVHITADERTAWNAKADATALNTHANNADIHVTKDQKDEWDAKATADDVATAKSEMLAEGKQYVDTYITWKTIE